MDRDRNELTNSISWKSYIKQFDQTGFYLDHPVSTREKNESEKRFCYN